jgi:comEA protein
MKGWLKNISFTKSESRVILFIVLVLVAGFSIKYYKQIISGNVSSTYDFTKFDSTFRSKSNSVKENKLSTKQADSSDPEDSLIRQSVFSNDTLNEKENLSETSGRVININTAGKDELVELPGVGESIAEKILDYRAKVKGFKNVEELMNVSGIGKKKFERIRSYIKTTDNN